ncbi:MAG: NAD(+)/NADH kinase [Acidimicrobiia bacterium]|nr:NAD(+)/NADH kinase [Acidimicrobiia bacterium]
MSAPTGGQRVAAAVSLVSVAGAVALAVIGAVGSWQGVLVTLAGLLLVVVAGWYAVSRRGAVRSAALVAAVVGVALFVTGFFITDLSAPRIAATVVLAALSVGMGRVALSRSPQALLALARSRTPAAPAQRPVLIMNLKSGGGKAERFHLEDECRARGIEPIVLRPGDDLLQLAEDAIGRGADVIGMAGGDGSQALVATVAAKHGIPHVVVPAGTRNHFALDLGLDRDDVVGALDAYRESFEVVIDLATVNGRVFVNNATAGLYAKIVQSPEYRGSKAQTTMEMLPDLLGPGAPPLDLRFTDPDGDVHPTAHVILVSNNPYQLHSIAGVGTRKRLDLGLLGVVTVRISNAGDAGAFAALEAAGRPQRYKGWMEWAAPEFRLDSDGPVEIGLDGEALKLDPPLVFETMPAALCVRLPRHAIGRSPAARAVDVLSQSTITELARVVAGRAPESKTALESHMKGHAGG